MRLFPIWSRKEGRVIATTKLDDEDHFKLNDKKWFLHKRAYAMRREKIHGKIVVIFLHRVILTPPPLKVIDHINGDKLDNRKENLRIATVAENLRNRGKQKNNTTGFKGVSLRKGTNKFIAQIRHNCVVYKIGYFSTAPEAALAYNQWAKRLHGVFAYQNPL